MKTIIKLLLLSGIFIIVSFSGLFTSIGEMFSNFNSNVISFLPSEMLVLFLFLGFLISLIIIDKLKS